MQKKKMKFAIRDDDISFFSKAEDLEKAYSFMTRGGCVSLSVVPFTYPVHKSDVFPYGEGLKSGYYDIAQNTELIHYLNESIKKGKYDVLLHGYSHEYRQVSGEWKAEMIWKSEELLSTELQIGKKHLEEVFSKKIRVFVAPNNSIDSKAIRVIENLGMDYSGIIMHKDRDLSLKYCVNYIKRWAFRLLHKIPYPGVLDYGKHKELVAFTLDDYERLIFEYEQCKKRGQPFVVYTHYWQLLKNDDGRKILEKIYNYVLDDGAEMVPLSECFQNK